jgi:hypothetical protein
MCIHRLVVPRRSGLSIMLLQSPQIHLCNRTLVAAAAQRLEEPWAWGLDPWTHACGSCCLLHPCTCSYASLESATTCCPDTCCCLPCWCVPQSPQIHLCDRTLVAAAQRLEEAWAWGLDPDLWRAHLGPSTWPEVLRQHALASGAGGSRYHLKPQPAAEVSICLCALVELGSGKQRAAPEVSRQQVAAEVSTCSVGRWFVGIALVCML